ncbi:hypothetical protein HPB47_002146, partial [Ixodes persulcatus]
MADETTDIAGVEQLLLCARYVDIKRIVIKEEFPSPCPAAGCILFVPVTDMTGKGLASLTVKSLNDIGVATEYLKAQAYDGAASLSEAYNGVHTLIQQQFPNAIYVH